MSIVVERKFCKDCREPKPVSDFYVAYEYRGKPTYGVRCKTCDGAQGDPSLLKRAWEYLCAS